MGQTAAQTFTLANTGGVMATDSLTGNSGHLYWTNFGAGTISKVNLDGTSQQTSSPARASHARAVPAHHGHGFLVAGCA